MFDNMSRYVAMRAGSISPAVLFYNDSRKTPGLITRYDCVVIDEAQKVKADSSGELSALLKSYLESGKFGRGSASSISAEAGLVMLANIDIDEHRNPISEDVGIFRLFPNFLRETAFIDRFFRPACPVGICRASPKTRPRSISALKGIFLAKFCTRCAVISATGDYVKTTMELQHCDDMRDAKAIEAGASGIAQNPVS